MAIAFQGNDVDFFTELTDLIKSYDRDLTPAEGKSIIFKLKELLVAEADKLDMLRELEDELPNVWDEVYDGHDKTFTIQETGDALKDAFPELKFSVYNLFAFSIVTQLPDGNVIELLTNSNIASFDDYGFIFERDVENIVRTVEVALMYAKEKRNA